jgi:hypothetical protein
MSGVTILGLLSNSGRWNIAGDHFWSPTMCPSGHRRRRSVFAPEVFDADAPDYTDAHDLVLTLLDELQSINLDHPDTQKAIELIKFAFGSK